MGQFEPSTRKAIREIVEVILELLSDFAEARVDFDRHIRIGHDRHTTLRGIFGVHWHVFFGNTNWRVLLCTGWGFHQFPIVFEQEVQIAVVPFGRVRGPGAFDARGHGVRPNAATGFVQPAKAHVFDFRAFGLCAQLAGIAIAVRLTDGMATDCQRHGFLIIHRHTAKGNAHILSGVQRVRLSVHTFWVHIDQTHDHSRQRVLEAFAVIRIGITTIGQPLALGAPIGVFLWRPDVWTAIAEAKGFQTHGFIGHSARKDDQIGPAELVAVFLFDRP